MTLYVEFKDGSRAYLLDVAEQELDSDGKYTITDKFGHVLYKADIDFIKCLRSVKIKEVQK